MGCLLQADSHVVAGQLTGMSSLWPVAVVSFF